MRDANPNNKHMRVKISNKVINGNQCYDVTNRGKIVKTFIDECTAQAYVTEHRIANYTKSKSYVEEMAFVNYLNKGL